MRTLAAFLSWPYDSGVAGGLVVSVALGAPAYWHTHATRLRHHREHLAELRKNKEG